jgi:LCP family protein required for cell wall assembly
MSQDPEDRDEPEYRVYRGSGATPAGRRRAPSAAPERPPGPRSRPPARPGDSAQPDYNVYRSQPRGVLSRLRGESESDVGRRVEEAERRGATRRETDGRDQARRAVRGTERRRGPARWAPGTWTVRRAIKYIVSALVAWVVLSIVLFFISAETKKGNLPAGLQAALSKDSSPMLFSAQNVLVLGLDNRPKGNKEPGANFSEADANTDSIMLWHVGGGVSRRLSIPRDTAVDVPGRGEAKINAAWATSPATTVKVVESLTGVTINHVIVVDLGNFPNFINDIGGVSVTNKVPICSEISGGVKNGGYTLNLKPGSHHLNGVEALTYARTRHNSCDPGYTDLEREAAQQEILNGIKSSLFSVHAFLHLPWASWDAPGVIQTDMGGPTLMQLFISSEIGGSPKPMLLSETAENGTPLGDILVPNKANVAAQVDKLLHG